MSQYPGAYPPPPQLPYAVPTPLPVRPSNWVGGTALAVAVVGLVVCWSVVGGVLFGVLAIVLGISGRGRVKRGQANNGAVATSGIALGVLAIVVSLALIAFWVRIYHDVDVARYVDCVSNTTDQQGARMCAHELQDRVHQELGVASDPGSA